MTPSPARGEGSGEARIVRKERSIPMSKVSTCLWFGKDAEAAVRLYVSLVPGSSIDHILHAPGAWPGGDASEVILMTFTLGGQRFQALNGGTPANYGTAAS